MMDSNHPVVAFPVKGPGLRPLFFASKVFAVHGSYSVLRACFPRPLLVSYGLFSVTLARGAVITDRDLPPEIRFHPVTTSGSLSERLEAVEREMLLSALEKNGWIQTHAAESLGISERVLRYKIKKHDIIRKA
jgi:hypothetical protein